MKMLYVGSNKYSQVDDADFERLKDLTWHFDGRYAYRFDEERHKVYLHKVICDGDLIDHDDKDKLNNQRYNLKPSNQHLNQLNRET